jgi:RNA polymerase sigma-70 factor (ECF subfamily)
MGRTLRDLETLYHRTHSAVFARCKALVGNDADARDLAQEVYMTLLERPDAFRGEASEIGYLFAIASNRAISRLRARIRRSEDWEQAVASMLEATHPAGDPSKRLEAKQLLVRAFSSTDETTALMALYHFADGLSQGEVGELLGLSRVTVNQRLQAFRAAAEQGEPA